MTGSTITGVLVVLVSATTTTRHAEGWMPAFRPNVPSSASWKIVPPNAMEDKPKEEQSINDTILPWKDDPEFLKNFPQTLQGDEEGVVSLGMTTRTLENDSKSVLSKDIDYSTMSSMTGVDISYTDADTLQVEFPAAGVTANAVVAGTFSLAWFSALVPATTSLAVAPILLPFYLAGGLVVKQAIVDPFTCTALSLGTYAWSLDISRYKGPAKSIASGATKDVVRAMVVERTSVNEQKQVRYRYELQLVLKMKQPVKIRDFSCEYRDQAHHLAATINRQLDNIHAREKDKSSSTHDYRFLF